MLDFSHISRVKPGELFIKNKLSKKPAQAMEKLEKVIKSQNKYNMSVTQDYSKNAIELNLLGRSYGYNEGYQVYQTRYVPTTSAAKAYEKTAKEMMETEEIAFSYALSNRKEKPSLFEKLLDYFDNIIK